MLSLHLLVLHWLWKLRWHMLLILLMFLISLMLRSLSFKITCGLKLLRWSTFFTNFESISSTSCSKYACHYVWSLFQVFTTCEKLFGTWGLYSSCFWIWCKCGNPSSNDNLWSTKPYYLSMYNDNCLVWSFYWTRQ
jgi:hypothetical protein